LLAYLLYGKFDALSAVSFFNSYLAGRGFFENRRELVGDYLFHAPSPFSHNLEEGFFWPILQCPPQLGSVDQTRLVSSCYKAMSRAGIKGYTPLEPGAQRVVLKDRLGQAMDNIQQCWANGLNPPPLSAENAIITLLYAIDRSVDLSVPFFSCDAAAPAWIRKDLQLETAVMKIVLEEVDWLPRPRSFREAYLMSQDERIVGLRTYIRILTESASIGNSELQGAVRSEIKKELRYFHNKPWASRVAKFVAYAAVPAEIAGILCEAHMVGVTIAGLGAACEWIGSICAKRKNKHWLSMTRIPHYKS